MLSTQLPLLRLAGRSLTQQVCSASAALVQPVCHQGEGLTESSQTSGMSVFHGSSLGLTSLLPAWSSAPAAAGSSCQSSIVIHRAASTFEPVTQSRCMHAEAGSDKLPTGTEGTVGDEAPARRRRLERRPHWASDKTADEKMDILLMRLEEKNISLEFDLVPGEWSKNTMCPQCEGGNRSEKSFVVRVAEDCESAFYRCYRVNKCNWKGSVQL